MAWEDPIIAEIRKYREEYAARFNYDIKAMYEDIKKRQLESGYTYVDLSQQPKPPYESLKDKFKKAS